MKTQILKSIVSFMLLAISATISAQFAIRPYVGINSSTLTKELFSDDNSRATLGYQVGADLQIGSRLYFQPGVQLEFLKNSEMTGPVSSVEDFDLNRTYLRVPVMIGYNFAGTESPFGFRIFTGPNAAFRLSGKVGNNGIVGDVDPVDNLQSVIFGWNVGAGIDLIKYVFVDAGYQFGLTEVFEDTEGLNTGIRNNLFYLNAGLRFVF